MKRLLMLMCAALTLGGTGCIVTPVEPGPPPEPVAEVYGPAPYPGAVWVVGGWHWYGPRRRWAWHHGYWR